MLLDPVYLAYYAIYINYEILSGNREGKTLNLETLLSDDMGLQIRDWERKVRNVYLEDSPQEKSIFPNKRGPFSKGTYEERILAVGALGQRLAMDADATLVAYAPTVISFHNILLAARDSQQQDEGTLALLAVSRNNQRELLAQELYGILGSVMSIHKANPIAIEAYFPMEMLRDGGADDALSMEATAPTGISIVEADFGEEVELTAATKFKITHLGEDGQLTFYFSDTNPSPPMPPQFLMLEPGDSKTPTLAQLGFPKAFFLVSNSSPIPALYRIEIVEE
jgi:hypothetical protein